MKKTFLFLCLPLTLIPAMSLVSCSNESVDKRTEIKIKTQELFKNLISTNTSDSKSKTFTNTVFDLNKVNLMQQNLEKNFKSFIIGQTSTNGISPFIEIKTTKTDTKFDPVSAISSIELIKPEQTSENNINQTKQEPSLINLKLKIKLKEYISFDKEKFKKSNKAYNAYWTKKAKELEITFPDLRISMPNQSEKDTIKKLFNNKANIKNKKDLLKVKSSEIPNLKQFKDKIKFISSPEDWNWVMKEFTNSSTANDIKKGTLRGTMLMENQIGQEIISYSIQIQIQGFKAE